VAPDEAEQPACDHRLSMADEGGARIRRRAAVAALSCCFALEWEWPGAGSNRRPSDFQACVICVVSAGGKASRAQACDPCSTAVARSPGQRRHAHQESGPVATLS
jgi:hypothetical protein